MSADGRVRRGRRETRRPPTTRPPPIRGRFTPNLGRPDFAFLASGWQEKRDMLTPLPPVAPNVQWTNFLADAAARVGELAVASPDLSQYTAIPPGAAVACGAFTIAFNATDGSIASLLQGGREWAGDGLLRMSYQTFTEADFDQFNREYNPRCGPPCGDFAKEGMDEGAPVSATWLPTAGTTYRANTPLLGAACTFLQLLTFPQHVVDFAGAPRTAWLNVSVDLPVPGNAMPAVYVEATWRRKTLTRMAEAMWVSFSTPPVPGGAYALDVLGAPVDPADVVVYGTRRMHAVDRGWYALAGGGLPFLVATLDAPLVGASVNGSLLRYDNDVEVDFSGGWHSLVM